jgi:hypothetical protein
MSPHFPRLKSVSRFVVTSRLPTLNRMVGHEPDSDDTMPESEMGEGDGPGEGDGEGVGVGVGVGEGPGAGDVAASCDTV